MVAFDKATQLPASVDTIEKLIVWTGFLAEYQFRPDLIRISPTESRKPADRADFINPDGAVIYQFQQSVIISDDAFTTTTGKIWDYAQVISNLAIPASYTT